MSFAIFGIPALKTPAPGQGLTWDGMKYEPGTTGPAASSITGLTLNRVPFGNSLGGLQDSGNLTFDGTTLTLTGAQSISGQLTSTVSTGTAPFVVASTTQVANLNVSQLIGGTWAVPGAIGSTTKNTGAFTTLTTTGATTFTAGTASTSTSTGTAVVTGGVGVSGRISSDSAVFGDGTTPDPFSRGYTKSSGIGSAAGSAGFTINSFTGNSAFLEMGVAGTRYFSFNVSSSSADLNTVASNPLTLSTANVARITIASGGDVSISNTTASTTTGAGALTVAGGLGVAGNITFSGASGASLRVVNATANAAVATTLGSVGPTGSTAGNPQGWLRISVAGTDRYIPFW